MTETEKAVLVVLSCGHVIKRVRSKLKNNRTYCWSCRKEVSVND